MANTEIEGSADKSVRARVPECYIHLPFNSESILFSGLISQLLIFFSQPTSVKLFNVNGVRLFFCKDMFTDTFLCVLFLTLHTYK